MGGGEVEMGGCGRTGEDEDPAGSPLFPFKSGGSVNMIFVEEDLLENGGETGIVENIKNLVLKISLPIKA